MKKAFSALLAMALLLALAGCGEAPDTAQPPVTESVETSAPDSSPAGEEPESGGESTEDLLELVNSAAPAAEPETCGGFESLSWGDGFETLTEQPYLEIIQRGVPVGGVYGSACYSFDAEGKLILGVYRVNENASLSWHDAMAVFLGLRGELVEKYGEPAKPDSGETLEDVISAGEGAWTDVWQGVKTPEGRPVSVQCQMQANGMIAVSFMCR